MDKLTLNDIDDQFRKSVFTQDYSPRPQISGVQFMDIKNFIGEDGDFSELLRVDETGRLEIYQDFQIRQINRSLVLANSIKAWHLHYNQEDIWYIPPHEHLLVGLVDLRKNSPTTGIKMRFVMGGGKSQLVLIPRGVAHGAANLSGKSATIIYFMNQQFNLSTPDELRLPWDYFGAEFWEMTKG